MTDRELLELAAKAAGCDFVTHTGYDNEDDVYVTHTWVREPKRLVEWNPLTNDGDALRLAVKLGISLFPPQVPEQSGDFAIAALPGEGGDWIQEMVKDKSPIKACRRAIVRAAAEIGRNMR